MTSFEHYRSLFVVFHFVSRLPLEESLSNYSRGKQAATQQYYPFLDTTVWVYENAYLSCEGRFVEVLLYVHRNRRLISDGSPGVHIDFHTAPELREGR